MAGYTNYPIYGQQVQPYYGQPMPQMQQMQQMPQQFIQQQMQQQMKQNEFVRVRSKEEAFGYPVAPGNSVTFVNETAPFCYVKTMGTSQLDRPTFETFRLVKVDDDGNPISEEEKPVKNDYSELKSEIEKLQKQVNDLSASVKTLKEKKPVKKVILQEAEDE